jgi:hypothetical protein
MRYLRLILHFARASFHEETAYPANFFINLLYSLLNLATGVLGVMVLFGQIETVNGWNLAATLALLGVFASPPAALPSQADAGAMAPLSVPALKLVIRLAIMCSWPGTVTPTSDAAGELYQLHLGSRVIPSNSSESNEASNGSTITS